MHKRGVRTYYTQYQCSLIMKEVKKKNMVSEVPQNAEVVTQNSEVDYQAIGKMIGDALIDMIGILENLLELYREDKI